MFAGSYAAATWVTGTAEGILFGTLPASGHPRSLGRSAECSSASSHFTKERFAPPRGVSWLPRKTDSARPNGSRWGGAEGCPLKERPQPALPPGGAVQRAARRRCQARAPKKDTPPRPSEMVHKTACTTMPVRLDRRVQCDRFNPICCADTECLRVVGQTLANERS